jgi:hypothetical protein
MFTSSRVWSDFGRISQKIRGYECGIGENSPKKIFLSSIEHVRIEYHVTESHIRVAVCKNSYNCSGICLRIPALYILLIVVNVYEYMLCLFHHYLVYVSVPFSARIERTV